MAKLLNNEAYLTTDEVRQYMKASKDRFYKNIHPHLQVYRFNGLRKPWYKEADVVAFAEGRGAKAAPIVLSGILRNWTEHVRALGYQIDTKNCTIETVRLSGDTLRWLDVPPFDWQFVRRTRISFVNQVPICVWSTYYPLVLAGGLQGEMQANESLDVVKRLKESRGLVIARAKDRYHARAASQYEQEILQLTRDEPILQVQRAAYNEQKTLVLYSDMALLGAWFAPEHEYPVDIW